MTTASVSIVVNDTGQAIIIWPENKPVMLPQHIYLRSAGTHLMIWNQERHPLATAQAEASLSLMMAREVFWGWIEDGRIVCSAPIQITWV